MEGNTVVVMMTLMRYHKEVKTHVKLEQLTKEAENTGE